MFNLPALDGYGISYENIYIYDTFNVTQAGATQPTHYSRGGITSYPDFVFAVDLNADSVKDVHLKGVSYTIDSDYPFALANEPLTRWFTDQNTSAGTYTFNGMIPIATTFRPLDSNGNVIVNASFLFTPDGQGNLTLTTQPGVGYASIDGTTLYLDATAPVTPYVNFIGLQDGDTVHTSSITLEGTTAPGSILTINGETVTVAADGSWSTTVTLALGANVITAVAENSRQVAMESITVNYSDKYTVNIVNNLSNPAYFIYYTNN